MRPGLLLLTVLATTGCGWLFGNDDGTNATEVVATMPTPTPPPPPDADEDGFSALVDCNDEDAKINPQANEICDGIDNDCDGAYDEEDEDLVRSTAAGVFYDDLDDDGYGAPGTDRLRCFKDSFIADRAGDCDDADPSRNPGQPDICDFGFDNDCDDKTFDRGIGFVLADGTALGSLADVDETTTTPYSNPYTYTPGTVTGVPRFPVNQPATLYVCEGRWGASLQVTADLTIIGVAGTSASVLSGGRFDRVLEVSNGATVTVRDVTLEDGRTSALGGVVSCAGDSTVTIDNAFVHSGEADEGGLVAAVGCELTVRNSDLAMGTAGTFSSRWGGLAYLEDTSATFENVDFTDGRASDGGLLATNNASNVAPAGPTTVSCTNCTFLQGSATRGGAIYLGPQTLFTMESGSILSNGAEFGGGVYIQSSQFGPAQGTFNGTTFAGNEVRNPFTFEDGVGPSVLSGIGGGFDYEGSTVEGLVCDNTSAGCR